MGSTIRSSTRSAGPAAPFDLDALATPAALVTAELNVLASNRSLRRLLGRRTVAGRRLTDLMVQAGGKAQGPSGVIYRLARDEAAQWLRLDLQPSRGGYLVLLTDVTAEHEAVEELRSSYAMRDRLLHDAEVGTWRYDPDADVYYFSDELSLGHQASAAPVSSALLARTQHRDDVGKDEAIRQRITHEGGSAESEMRYRTAAGGWTHLHVHYRAGRQTPSGLYEMYGLSQSITSLARARDEANINAQRLRLALQAARAGVFEYDYKRGRFWLSAEFAAMIGPEGEERGGRDPLLLFHPDDRAIARQLRGGAGRGGPEYADVRLMRPDGDRWVRFYLEVERDADGRPILGVGLMIDIDDQKRQQLALTEARRAAEDATAAKSNFLAAVSHEIRTPMNGIVGVLNLLGRERLTAEGAELLQEALGCSDMLSQLINDVLDFSKIEAGKLEFSPAPADPAQIALSVVNLLRGQAQAKGLKLALDAPAAGFASLDALRLRQCLFNVVGNAVKFTDQGGIEVRLSYVGEGEERKLRCEVEDTGIGVPEEARASLFDRFQQADSGATRKFGGTGLGLTISRSLARMMGGDMDFDSREGVGSTFWFEIRAPRAEETVATATDLFADAPLAGLRILVVDDNATNRLIGLKSAAALGADVEAVDSGRAAIEAVQRSDFDLVLMDVNMPGMDGMEATRRIRALGSVAAQTPVIALTADVMGHHLQAYAAAGMNGMVPKPFSPARLVAEVIRLAQADDGASVATCVA